MQGEHFLDYSSDGDVIERNRMNITGNINDLINEFIRTTEISVNILRKFQTHRPDRDECDANAISEILYMINELYGRLFLLIVLPDKPSKLKNIDGGSVDRPKHFMENIQESSAAEKKNCSGVVVSNDEKSIKMESLVDVIPTKVLGLTMVVNPVNILKTNAGKLTTTGLTKCKSSYNSLFDYSKNPSN